MAEIKHKQRMIDTHPDDEKLLETFNHEVWMLYGMVGEMMEDPKMLLSPVMRRMLADKAAAVASLHQPIRNRLAVDNPGEPLTRES